MDTKKLGRWLYLGGGLVTVVIAVFEITVNADADKWIGYILALAAILAGVWYADHNDAAMIGLRYLALVAVAGTLTTFLTFDDFSVGEYITTIAGAVVTFLGPYVLTVLFMRWFKKEFGS